MQCLMRQLAILETSTVDLDEASCAPHQVDPGGYVKIAVTDTGIGMDETTREQIFDPFYHEGERPWHRPGIGVCLWHHQEPRWPHYGFERSGSWEARLIYFCRYPKRSLMRIFRLKKIWSRVRKPFCWSMMKLRVIEAAKPMLEFMGIPGHFSPER